jgi:hypothetical protein
MRRPRVGSDLAGKRVIAFVIGFGVPWVAVVAMFPIYNRIEPLVLGMPFSYFWIFACFLLTTVCLAAAWLIGYADEDREEEDREENEIKSKEGGVHQ